MAVGSSDHSAPRCALALAVTPPNSNNFVVSGECTPTAVPVHFGRSAALHHRGPVTTEASPGEQTGGRH